MKNKIKEKLAMLAENKPYGQEGISKKVAELTLQKEKLIAQRDEITKQIKLVNAEINKWKTEISPNQISMF
jgi:hypothetical protein